MFYLQRTPQQNWLRGSSCLWHRLFTHKNNPREALTLDISNPQPAEDINTTKTHPLKEFFLLSGGILAVITVIVLVLSFLADTLTQYIPFDVERSLVRTVNIDTPANKTGIVPDYLQSLADNLSQQMDLPEGMEITVSVINSDTVNAFATLGGNVVFFTGLLNAIPSENTLAMVMAHEIAHIKLRHPMRALGRGVVVGVAVATMAGVAGNEIVAKLIGDTSLLTTLNFSRDQENASDKLAVAALAKYYGHVSGSIQLFKLLNKQQGESGGKIPEFFTTHPRNQNRIAGIQEYAQQNNWSIEGATNEIPNPVRDELKRLHMELSDKKDKQEPAI